MSLHLVKKDRKVMRSELLPQDLHKEWHVCTCIGRGAGRSVHWGCNCSNNTCHLP